MPAQQQTLSKTNHERSRKLANL